MSLSKIMYYCALSYDTNNNLPNYTDMVNGHGSIEPCNARPYLRSVYLCGFRPPSLQISVLCATRRCVSNVLNMSWVELCLSKKYFILKYSSILLEYEHHISFKTNQSNQHAIV